MKIFVTGGSGFIGRNFVEKALLAGHSVRNYDSLTYAAMYHKLYPISHKHYSFTRGDILDSDKLEEAIFTFCPDVILHFAAESHVDNSILAPENFINTNVYGTLKLLEVVRKYHETVTGDNFKFIHVSTDEVFGSLEIDNPVSFSEQSQYKPNSPYSASKAASDHLVNAWCTTYGIPVIITNCSNNYGPYQHTEKLIPKVIQKCMVREPVPIYGNGENVRDWLHVDDHTDALMLIVQSSVVNDRFCIGGNSECSNLALVKKLLSIIAQYFRYDFDYEMLITNVPDRLGHDLRYSVCSAKIARELGWTAKWSLEDGLQSTVAWYCSIMQKKDN